MADKENKRKCVKCGASLIEHNVKLFRFPKPAERNLIRCTLWARYLFPDDQDKHCSIAFQTKLHNEHKMLCQNHFRNEDFTDDTKTRLLRTAVPLDVQHRPLLLSGDIAEAQPGPSHATNAPLCDISNVGDSKRPPHKQKVLNENEMALYIKCEKYMQKICELHKRIKKLSNSAKLHALSQSEYLKKLSKIITPTFALLLQGQIRNSKRKSSGRRWTKEEKIVALRIYKRSPTAYRLLRRMMCLPSPGTLKTLLNKVPFDVGANQSVFNVLKHFIKKQSPEDNEYVLMFDEMSIKKHFEYNHKGDIIESFQDHGTQGRSPDVASYALVFMIGGIRKAVKQPIAHYFSSSYVSADRLAVLIKDILHQCFQAGINISATVCDMDGVNRRALSILGATMDSPYITMPDKREVVTLFDTPHLLKCFRSLFMKYDIECPVNISYENISGTGTAKWSHIEEFFEMDSNNPNFVFAPALTKAHLNPNAKQKMRVNLAAQVLSHTVAAGMYAKISDGALPANATVTADVISRIDMLFDCLNSDTADLRRGKKWATNMTAKSPHLNLFTDMKTFFKNMKFVGCQRTPPSQEGWIWTINGVERIFKNLKENHNIKSLSTRRLQQDILENLFGCIRGNCGSNSNPTTVQFVAGLKTAVLSSLAHIGTKGNCETDNNVIINNFDKLLTLPVSDDTEQSSVSEEISINEIDLPQHCEEDCAEMQACTYVCGFILKKIPVNNCAKCKEIFVSKDISKCHLFTQFKEYDDHKLSLNYSSHELVKYVETCAGIVNEYLTQKGHLKSVKLKITEMLKLNVNFDFINSCESHCQENLKTIINSVFEICVKRFCIMKNRIFADEAASSAIKRKMRIILHK